MTSRLAPAATFVGFALVAGALQIVATIVLGLADVDQLRAAAAEGSGYYVLGSLGVGLGMVAGWLLRKRPLVASVVFFVWELTVMFSLLGRTSKVGLAYHGEYILHHFAALVSAAACVSIGVGWARRTDLGPMRLPPAIMVAIGALGLLALHVLPQPGLSIRGPQLIGSALTAMMLVALPLALVVLWRHATPARYRFISLALLVPLVLRVVLAWPEGLSGGSVPDGRRFFLMASIVVAAGYCFFAFRPDAPRPVKVLVSILSALATLLIYLVYSQAFGQLEDGIGGLAQSLFGFSLPYPTYVAGWKIVAVSVALFCIFSCVYLGLMSWNERVRGLALGVLAITGIGLSNPQLVLMAAAAHLLWLDTLVTAERESEVHEPPEPIEDVLAAFAAKLGLPPPVVLEAAQGTVVSVRGDLAQTSIDVRARPRRSGGWAVDVRTGVVGRSRAELELVPAPGSAGERPAHPVGHTHRIRGSMRTLESWGDAPLDALTAFPDATVKFWAAGTQTDLGRDLSNLDGDSLTTLVRALSER